MLSSTGSVASEHVGDRGVCPPLDQDYLSITGPLPITPSTCRLLSTQFLTLVTLNPIPAKARAGRRRRFVLISPQTTKQNPDTYLACSSSNGDHGLYLSTLSCDTDVPRHLAERTAIPPTSCFRIGERAIIISIPPHRYLHHLLSTPPSCWRLFPLFDGNNRHRDINISYTPPSYDLSSKPPKAQTWTRPPFHDPKQLGGPCHPDKHIHLLVIWMACQ